MQHYQSLTHSSPSNHNTIIGNNSSGSSGGNGAGMNVAQLQQLGSHLRPQSAEKRRWLERMNLLRQHSLTNPAMNTLPSDTAQFMFSPATNTMASLNSDKVNRMAEADVAASQLIYSGNEKYFHIEYLEWMGLIPLQSGSGTTSNHTNTAANDTSGESGELCCPSCKNVVGGYSWNPSVK